ncbi:hypothetical protein GOBAR_DD31934 [Gossypium barbadense]|nr:hypothetical protein GOBAR_DD31934 [Gossypium barbadense]
MALTSTLPLYSHPKRLGLLALASDYGRCLGHDSAWFITRRRYSRSKRLVVAAAYGAEGGARRRVYRQSQAKQPLSSAPKQIATFVAPAGVFIAATFGMDFRFSSSLVDVLWKLVEKLLMPKPSRSSSVENKSPSQGVKWSFAPGTNLLSGVTAKIDRQSKLTLNEFAKELRAFSSVDMSGRNFGDEGLFFLAESLGYNQIVEEVSFAANGITARGMKAFNGVLEANMVLKTLDLSGNPIGDEGIKCLCDILVNNTGIQKLQLNSVDLGDEGAKAIAELLKKNSTLRALELNNNMIDYSGFTSLAGALLENKTIRNFHLNGNYGGALGANALAKGLEGNKSLRGGNNIRAKGVGAIAEALKDNTVITNLELGYNPIGADGAKALSEVLKFHGNVKTLKLGWCQIGPKGAEFVADMLRYNNTISILDLRANGLRDEGAACLARSLKVVNETLTSLDLGFNEIRDDGAFAIAQALKANEDVTVTSLNLASNFLTKFGQSALTDARDHVYEMSEREVNIFF